jgi:hypothetical protein
MSSASEPVGSDIRNIADVSPMIVISPICSHLNRVENDNEDIS